MVYLNMLRFTVRMMLTEDGLTNAAMASILCNLDEEFKEYENYAGLDASK